MSVEDVFVKRAYEIILANKYMTVAASTLDGKPWVAPVAFAFDSDCRFYWVSHRESLHSRLIETNPDVAIVIFDSTVPEGSGEGIYFEATAEALENPMELESALVVVNGRRRPSPFGIATAPQVSGSGFKRIYRAQPRAVSRLADDTQDGQRINIRLPIEFAALKALCRVR